MFLVQEADLLTLLPLWSRLLQSVESGSQTHSPVLIMIIGYVSAQGDDLERDGLRQALLTAGCTRLVEESIDSAPRSAVSHRPRALQLERLLGQVGEGDTILVDRLGSLGRSLPQLLGTLLQLELLGVRCRSLHEHFDSGSPSGRLLRTMLAILAEYLPDDSRPHAIRNR